MPYTEDFKKIVGHYNRQYSDKAKVLTFAFEEAFKKGIRTFTDREPLFKKNNSIMKL